MTARSGAIGGNTRGNRLAGTARSSHAQAIEMYERYEARDPRGNLLDVITGEARYSNPRKFTVTVDK